MTAPVSKPGQRPFPTLQSDACASISAELGEPLAGTAPVAKAWIVIEDPGPWPAKAVRESSRSWVRELDRRTEGTGVGALLMRRPGRAGRQAPAQQRALIATTLPGAAAAKLLTVEAPEELLGLELDSLVAGVLPQGGEPVAHPVLLVCTNGRRDPCCSVAGRALAERLSAAHPDAVYECSHLGGHRFAPTALVLPTGYVYGRLTVTSGLDLLQAPMAAGPVREHCRGRTTWDPLGQVAEIEVRRQVLNLDADALSVRGFAEERRTVSCRDGREWMVTLVREAASPSRAVSCGADAVDPAMITPGSCIAVPVGSGL